MRKLMSLILVAFLLFTYGCQSEEPVEVPVEDQPAIEEPIEEPVMETDKSKKVIESFVIEGIYNGIEMGETPKIHITPHEGTAIELLVFDAFSPSKLEQFRSHEDYAGLMVAVSYQKADIYFEKDEEFKRVLEIIDMELLEEIPEVNDDRYSVAGFENSDSFDNFFSSLRIFVNSDEREHLVELFGYPMYFPLNGEIIDIDDRFDMLEKYDEIFNPLVKFVINNQRLDDLMIRFEGIGIGSGQMLFGPHYNDPSKIMINGVRNNLVVDESVNDEDVRALFSGLGYEPTQLAVENFGSFGHLVRAYAGDNHTDSYLKNEYLVFKGEIVDYKYDQDRNESYSYNNNLSLLKAIEDNQLEKSRPTVFYAEDYFMVGAYDGSTWYDSLSYGGTFDMRKEISLDIYKDSEKIASLKGDEVPAIFEVGYAFELKDGQMEGQYIATDAEYSIGNGTVEEVENTLDLMPYVVFATLDEDVEVTDYSVKQFFQMDLESDGNLEYLVNITTFAEDFDMFENENFMTDEFNLIFMIKDNQVFVLDFDLYKEGMYTDAYAEEELVQFLDVDNDGELEVLKMTQYYESIGYHIYDFDGSEFVNVVSSYMGP